jgi:hypothetical protein
MSGVQLPYEFQYETVAPSATAQVLGSSGALGDYVHKLIVNVTTAATSTVTLIDGSTSIVIVPAVTPVGAYSIAIEAISASGAWKVTTGAGSSVMATGIFT